MARGGIKNIVEDGALGLQRADASGIFCAVGVSEKGAGKIHLLSDPAEVRKKLGDGPLSDMVVSALSVANTTCYALPVTGSVAGTVGTVTAKASNAGVGSVRVAGSPRNAYDIEVIITKAGGLNDATFKVKKDGVLSDAKTVPASPGTYTIEDTGLTLTFAPGTPSTGKESFALRDSFSFSSTAPEASTQDILSSVDTLIDSAYQFEWIAVAGISASALWVSLDTKAGAAESKQGRYIHFKLQVRGPSAGETVDQWVTALTGTERGPCVSKRVQVYAAHVVETDGISGGKDERHAIGLACGMSARRKVHEPVDATKYGPVPSVTALRPKGIKGSHIDALDNAGYTTICTYPGEKGFYITHGRMLAGLSSDFGLEERRRVMDYALKRVRDAQFTSINSTVEVGADGSMEGIEVFEAVSAQPLRLMEQEGMISGGEVLIDKKQDILSTEKIKTRVRIQPLGKASWIENVISFAKASAQGGGA